MDSQMPRQPKYTKTNPHIKEAAFGRLHKGGGASRPPPFVDSFMDGCVGAGEAADAAKHT